MTRLLTALCLLLVVAPTRAFDPEAQVPAALESWIPWVFEGRDQRSCPIPSGGGERLCAWPGRLDLDLDSTGGLFAQRWQVYAETWVPLPGGPGAWPQDVRLGGTPAAVVERAGAPAIRLEPGEHALSGRFLWSAHPETLPVPPETAMVTLRLDGEAVEFPRRDPDGRLWLGAGDAGGNGAQEDTLALEVYRKVDDDIPLRIVARLDLDVAGRAREVALGPVLLAGGIPLAVGGPLPARLEPDGALRLQVRPGHWVMEVTGHHVGPVGELALAARLDPWPRQEVWVFAAHPELREVQPSGAEPVDPRQTRLPADWARLPAFLLRPGEALRLTQVRRGDTEPAPDQLTLSRDLWLDFAGAGYTLRDRITGELTRTWRLEAGNGIDLGQVTVDGEPRFITRLDDSTSKGVEVRQGRLDLLADSRIDAATRRLPASGWALDFQTIETRLHLPPGWDLLAVSGVDNLPPTWLNRWSLLDLFLVLVISLAVGHLWGWGWGALALLTLALTWQLAGAPHLVWLHVLGAYALLRLLPAEPARAAMARVRRFVGLYYRAALVVLAVIALPFLVTQVRNGIYPQLDRPWPVSGGPATAAFDSAPAPLAEAPDTEAMEATVRKAQPRRRAEMPLAGAPPAPRPLAVVDPKAQVQTGPGVPDFTWKSWTLAWRGPLPPDHQMMLWLRSPGWGLLLALAQTGLILLLGLKLAGLLGRVTRGTMRGAPAAAVLLAMGLSGTPSPSAADTFPSQELLDTLKARLTEPPDCLPACADIPRMLLRTGPGGLQLRLDITAAEAVAVPLPGGADAWTPTGLRLDDVSVDSLRRGADGTYLIALPAGRWHLTLSGPLSARSQVALPLPLRPRRVEVAGEGWRVEGLDANGRPQGQLQLVRLSPESGPGTGLAPAELPPLLRVERTLRLGLDWRVETRVLRLSPPQFPVALEVPLLPGERVLQEGVAVRDGRLLVNLAPGATQSTWQSSLEPVDGLRLTAAGDDRLSEEWRVEASPLWHLAWEGIPVVRQASGPDPWVPTWRPWPGEEVQLRLSRPAGVPGPTLTLDQASYRLVPGRRLTDATLELSLRSSQGGEHAIRLPPGADLTRVRIDGVERPLRLEEGRLTLPLVPATERVEVTWRQPDPLTTRYSPAVPDLGMAGVNARVQVSVPRDRWILFLGGPAVGPAVLFWGLVVVLVLLAIGLARSRLTPLRFWDWLLLGLGLSQAGIWAGVLLAGWLFALGLRGRLTEDQPPWRFNLVQIGLVILSLAALAALLAAVKQGLLGPPEMQIAGNGSSATSLAWYQDRFGQELPGVWIVSVPMLAYRALMLAWALWLAVRLLDWLRWGWGGFSTPVLWREVKLKLPVPARASTGKREGEAGG